MQDLRTHSGSGYESDSEPSVSEDEPANFSPVKFTSAVVDDVTSDVVIPAIKGTDVEKDATGQSDSERCAGNDTTDQSDSERDTGNCTADQGEKACSQVQVSQASEQLSRLTPHQCLLAHSSEQNHSISQDSESTLCTSVDDTQERNARAVLGHLTSHSHQSLDNCSSTVGGAGDQVGAEVSSVGTDRDKSLASSESTSSFFYKSQDVPDMEDGVMIDIFESGNDGSPEKKLPLTSDETQEGVIIDQCEQEGGGGK